ncbi:MAG: hypothetical protein Q3966_05105 [Neisseria sp.]|nr:hypothetical protein [Neisseria sp.]
MRTIILIAAVLLAPTVSHAADNVEQERERWALYAREGGGSRLEEAAAQMGRLYRKSRSPKVRADWIALLIRQGRRAEALSACPACRPSDYLPDELENLAKAARDEKQFDKAYALYLQLQKADPSRKIGWLGAVLTAADKRDAVDAMSRLAQYRLRFGDDEDAQMANGYIVGQTETAVPSRQAVQKEAVLAAYREAAAKRDFDTQQKIILQHPEWFSQKDRLWLRESQLAAQLRQAREAGDKAALEGVYRGLGEIIGQTEENSEIHIQAKRDRMAASIALGRDKEALADYHALSKWQEQPEYVKEQYQQALSMNRKPITARKDAPPYLVDKGTLVDALGNPIPPMDSAVEGIARGEVYSNPGKARSLQFRVPQPVIR